jgi:hypothetical protein
MTSPGIVLGYDEHKEKHYSNVRKNPAAITAQLQGHGENREESKTNWLPPWKLAVYTKRVSRPTPWHAQHNGS